MPNEKTQRERNQALMAYRYQVALRDAMRAPTIEESFRVLRDAVERILRDE